MAATLAGSFRISSLRSSIGEVAPSAFHSMIPSCRRWARAWLARAFRFSKSNPQSSQDASEKKTMIDMKSSNADYRPIHYYNLYTATERWGTLCQLIVLPSTVSLTRVWGPTLARGWLVFYGKIERRGAGFGVWFPWLQAVQGPSGALGAPQGFARGPTGGRLSSALRAVEHDLFEQIDRRCFDGPGEAQLAQMGPSVAGQRFASVEQLTTEITEDCWWGLHVCGGHWETGDFKI